MQQTHATTTFIKSMCTESMPRQHVQTRCAPYQCHNNMFQVYVSRIKATAVCSKMMCTISIPEQHFHSRCAPYQWHSNMFEVDVPRINATAKLSKPTCRAVNLGWDPVALTTSNFPSTCRLRPGYLHFPCVLIHKMNFSLMMVTDAAHSGILRKGTSARE